jgi:hypothetical protein
VLWGTIDRCKVMACIDYCSIKHFLSLLTPTHYKSSSMMCAARLHSRILLPERLQERPRRIAKFPVPVDACTVRQSQRGHSVRRKYQVRAFALAEFLRKAPPFFSTFPAFLPSLSW